MPELKISRPKLPKGYADNPASYVDWEWIAAQLTESKNYWLCSVRPDGRPHVIPRWGAYMDNRFYYDGSPETRHARNIVENPHVSLHLENGTQVVILEGTSRPAGKPEPEFAKRLAESISNKYGDQGYSPKPDQWDEGGLYVFTPRQCIAWTSFFENPTKFVFVD
ncbi:MAG TPA: pyridoxamine 5'-phosphate oxidase family protein [Anaerolineales bacterium]|nr:pyridoxamine 5'-phosphate oxidase family protein [Anaerolineales bacterium]